MQPRCTGQRPSRRRPPPPALELRPLSVPMTALGEHDAKANSSGLPFRATPSDPPSSYAQIAQHSRRLYSPSFSFSFSSITALSTLTRSCRPQADARRELLLWPATRAIRHAQGQIGEHPRQAAAVSRSHLQIPTMTSRRESRDMLLLAEASPPPSPRVLTGRRVFYPDPPPPRTTKASGKLKILPEEPESNARHPTDKHDTESSDDDDDDDKSTEGGDKEDLYKRLAHIPEGSMRRDARRLTRRGRATLPRVTAYSTATWVWMLGVDEKRCNAMACH